MDGKKEKVSVRSVGIVGYGNFGSFVHVLLKRFAPSIPVRVFEPKTRQTRQMTIVQDL